MTLYRRDGFSLVELAIVVLIIGILAALAIPLFALIMKESRFSTLASDLRTHSEAFQTYALEEGDYPPSHGATGSYVPELTAGEKGLSTAWLEPTPIGGYCTWVHTTGPDPALRNAYIQIVPTAEHPLNVSLGDIAELDEEIDDGNTSDGYLQVAGGRIRYYIKLGND